MAAVVGKLDRIVTDDLRDVDSLGRNLEITRVSAATMVLLHAVHVAHGTAVCVEVSLQAAFDGVLLGGRVAVGSGCVKLVLGVVHSAFVVTAVFGVGVCFDSVCDRHDGVCDGDAGVDA